MPPKEKEPPLELTNEQKADLIERVKNHPILYDVNMESYRNSKDKMLLG